MTIAERIASADVAELWIRESLTLDLGAELTVTGTCMEPALMDGGKIRLQPMKAPPRLGDVVLLRTLNGLRLHRVLFRSRRSIRTKGDQGAYLDPKTPDTAILAVWESTESFATRYLRIVLSLSRLLLRVPRRFVRPASVR
ncbi:MAG: S24/S26 family peptidase [Vicinamibacteria bacterium]